MADNDNPEQMHLLEAHTEITQLQSNLEVEKTEDKLYLYISKSTEMDNRSAKALEEVQNFKSQIVHLSSETKEEVHSMQCLETKAEGKSLEANSIQVQKKLVIADKGIAKTDLEASRISDLEALLSAASTEVVDLKQKMREHIKLQEQLLETRDKLKVSECEKKELENKTGDFQNTLSKLVATFNSLDAKAKSQISELEAELAEAKATISDLRSELDNARKMINALQSFVFRPDPSSCCKIC